MSRRPAPMIDLGERDQALLADAGRLRFASAEQLLRLHFNTGTPVGRQRRGQSTLRRLTIDGYLHRLPRRVGGHASGSGRFVYELGYRGQREVWPDRPARTPDGTGLMFVRHCLAIGDIVVELVEAELEHQCSGLAIETEPEVWRRYLGPHGSALVLKPDLGVNLSIDDTQHVWFVEVDRSTQAPKRVAKKARQYIEYWRTGVEQEALGTFPRVLWSVPDERRQDSIERALAGLPEPASQMFAVTTAEQSTDLLLGAINNQTLKGGA